MPGRAHAAELEIWLERCSACETTWVPRRVRATLERLEARSERREHVAKQPREALRQQARAIAMLATPEEPSARLRVSPAHAILALLGFPVVTGTERMREPIATWLLALGLVAVYVGQFAFGSLDETIPLLGYRAHDGFAIQLFTAVIAHAGWLHLIGNVYFLVAFGDGVEQYLPRWLMLAAFFVLGAVTLAIDAAWSDSDALFVGASGGVAVLMGACAVLQPRARVVTRIVVFVLPVRIVWYVAMELALQSYMAWTGVPGVAWVAHLVGNAIKFTPDGGRIEISTAREGDEVRVSVSDTGPGVDPEHVPHVFERFWQAPNGTPRGAGLGLYIAKGIMDAHGGRIWVDSVLGRGATFHIALPVAQ